MDCDESIEIDFEIPDYLQENIDNLIKARKEKRLNEDCEDFTGNGWRLVEFQNLKNSFPETPSSSNGRTTAL